MPRVVHVSYTALTNHGKDIPYMHRTSIFVCIPIPFQRVYRPGAFGWNCALVAFKKIPSW